MKNFSLSKAVVPNTFTALNIFSGFIALIFATHNDFKIAAAAIIAAAIFDTLDGIIARLLNTSSQFGVELDSLADIVSFGAAPSILIYQSHLYELDIWGILISSLILVFGAFRLARFNVQLEDISVKIDFKGLPIPVSAITIALMVISFYKDGKIIDPYSYLVIPLILILSFLMVSNVRYNALPKLTGRSVRDKVIIIILLIIALIVVLATNGVALFFIFLAFVLFGILRHIFYMIFPYKNEINNVNEETN